MGEVRELESREHELGNMMMMCETIEELDRFATTFNNLYKTIRDHKVRLEEIHNGLESRFG